MRSWMLIGLLVLFFTGCESQQMKVQLDQQKYDQDMSLKGQVISRVEWSRSELSTDTTRGEYVIHFRDGGKLVLEPHKRYMSVKQEGIHSVSRTGKPVPTQ